MSRENVEVVRRWYTMLPDLREVGPGDDPAFADRAFGVFLDDEYELQLSGGYRRASRSSEGERDSRK